MSPETLLEILLVASNAQTPEEKARIVWRFSDSMWRRIGDVPMGFARAFNNLAQDQNYPWVKNLWTRDEVVAHYKAMGLPDDQIAKMFPLKVVSG